MSNNIKQIQNKFNFSLIYLCPIIVIIFITAVFFVPGKILAFDNESVTDFNDGWAEYTSEGLSNTFSLPIIIDTDAPITLSKTIPDNLGYPVVLGFHSSHQKVRVFCDNEQIYSFGYDNQPLFGKSPGSAYNLVRLPKESAEKTLTIELHSPYSAYNGKIGKVQTGSKAALIFSLIRSHIFSLLTTIIIFVAGVVTLIAHFFIIGKDNNITKETLYLGLFAIFVSLWLFGECRLTQFFYIPPALNTCVTIIAMLSTPIPLVKYIACGQNVSKRWLLNLIAELLSLLLIISVFLQALNIVDFMQQLSYIHVCFAISVVLTLYAVISDVVKHQNPDRNQLLISFGVLVLFFLFEIIVLYVGGHNVGSMMRIGVFVFITMQAQSAFKKATGIIHLSRLASVDALTNCLNRTVYNQYLSEYDGKKDVCIVIGDINYLKTINDTFGHTVGDEAIVRCANNFTQALSPYGHCFRIGGDEFAMIGKNISQQKISELCSEIYKLCDATNEETIFPFSISLGYAIYSSKDDHSLLDTVRRADKLMYENKCLFKHTNDAQTATC